MFLSKNGEGIIFYGGMVYYAVDNEGRLTSLTETKLYRKKPVVIKAYVTQVPMMIETLEGAMRASPGDYIITGVKGEQYPCKPDVFEQTYEPVQE